jgi:hypothetical protein
VHICWSEEGAYDTEGLYYAERHGLQSFILLHDTMVIKDQSLFDILKDKGETKITDQMFLAKFVAPYNLPDKPRTKAEAIDMETFWFTPKTCETLFPELLDVAVWEEKNGRMNMVIENDFIKKWKGNWGQKQYV